MSKFVTNTYGGTKELLKFPDHYVALAVTVDDDGVAAVDGKKIVPAGTIVGGKTGAVLGNLNQKVVEKIVIGDLDAHTATGAEGVLKYDVDVTHGPTPGAMLIHGFIAQDKLPYVNKPAAAAAAADLLPMIKFIK